MFVRFFRVCDRVSVSHPDFFIFREDVYKILTAISIYFYELSVYNEPNLV